MTDNNTIPPIPPTTNLIPVVNGVLFTTLSDLALLHCVYLHKLDGVVFFVGLQPLNDAYQCLDARSNSEWAKFIGNNVFTMELDMVSTDRFQLASRRFQLIQHHKPHANLAGSEMVSGVSNAIMCNETGERFATMSAAAMAHGISQSQLSNHIAGRKYYARIKGRTYKRVD